MPEEDKYVVVMFEPARPGENLKLSEQVNEVFGPFTEEEAERWTARMQQVYEKANKSRQWLITPMSDPAVVNQLCTESN